MLGEQDIVRIRGGRQSAAAMQLLPLRTMSPGQYGGENSENTSCDV